MAEPLLRERANGEAAPVSTVELFFDLVFVFAITQIGAQLTAKLDAHGALHAGLMLAAVWWVWVYTTWATNFLNPENRWVRSLLFALMGAGLMMSSAIPDAFGDAGWVFAAAYVAFQVGRTGFVAWAVRGHPQLGPNFLRVSLWLALSAVFWLAGGQVRGEDRIGLWLAALAIEYIGPAAGFWIPGIGRSRTRDWDVEGGHASERVGLFILICLGESILVTGLAFAKLAWTPSVTAAFAIAFVGAVAMWWIYFNATAAAAGEALARAADPGRVARRAFTYAPILVVAGIVVSAVGDARLLAEPDGPLETPVAAALIGGPLLFLIGAQVFKLAVFGAWAPSRLTGIAALGALGFAAPLLTPLGLAAAAAAVLAGVAAWETMAGARSPPALAKA